ncbi:bifunctional DNA-formamidopyrimidine glycosylase/DNA-(apurinic or apyrimidinic site) lyase [Williamsia sp. CHRR-6]|uniref:bifunctional DNA-formamidopyrimidine glycosylase/DNA-(apurinic or apyrimidinic site) lyase n=1 Tax=Williamsia sp. CHRR-6 TaxID=2835871 RepID=UPI001BDB3218|nr:bifunctional DNA-formamidopyrimidine glycosylase/DNA-(apurinic or apyrimidinic site) lyase [Williamsia sp. CHRR-6]MBT0568337.1 bifunctional DNA-formamidopyrimidine glycosylase/DNA-(apurinic or apyrimidinic site) lyase [Williamsia sp. CHRR-6]
MPELPEVEVVRLGLHNHAVGRTFGSVSVRHPRAVRRHLPGAADLAGALAGSRIAAARRRGKYLWLDLTRTPGGESASAPEDVALVIHLGMSGQMLVCDPGAPDEVHLRVRAELDDGRELRFVDQRTFGGWFLDDYVVDPAQQAAEPGAAQLIPSTISHIGPDPFDPHFDPDRVVAVWRSRHTEIKRALLDQNVVSGVGNIYADEALWRSKIHGARMTDELSRPKLRGLLDAASEVMAQALEQGGTSFDRLYVNVNGQSGYFERSLNAYGREGQPCRRCGRIMRREQFMNRSSFSCPKCQVRPRGI